MQVTMMKDFAFGTKKLREFNVVREAGQHYSNENAVGKDGRGTTRKLAF